MRALYLFPVALLAACQKQPDFEQRFANQALEIERAGNAMERDIVARIDAADNAERAMTDAPAPDNISVPRAQ